MPRSAARRIMSSEIARSFAVYIWYQPCSGASRAISSIDALAAPDMMKGILASRAAHASIMSPPRR